MAGFAPNGLDGALILAGGDAAAAVASAVEADGRRVFAPNGVEPAPDGIERFDGVPSRDALDRMNALIEQGPFEMRIAERFPLDRAADAHEALKRHRTGKIVLKPGG